MDDKGSAISSPNSPRQSQLVDPGWKNTSTVQKILNQLQKKTTWLKKLTWRKKKLTRLAKKCPVPECQEKQLWPLAARATVTFSFVSQVDTRMSLGSARAKSRAGTRQTGNDSRASGRRPKVRVPLVEALLLRGSAGATKTTAACHQSPEGNPVRDERATRQTVKATHAREDATTKRRFE